MYVTIKLHGALARKFGKTFRCVASNTVQAIRFLEVNFKDFRKWVLEADSRGILFQVKTNSYELSESELFDPIAPGMVIHLTPLFAGAGGSNLIRVVLGVGLIAAGLIFSGGLFGLSSLQMIITGGLLLISGLMGKKTPPPDEQERSFIFSGAANVSTIGGRVPIVYGVIQTGSTVVSASVRSYVTVT